MIQAAAEKTKKVQAVAKPKAAAKKGEAEVGEKPDEFKKLSRKGKINRFDRSIMHRTKRMAKDGSQGKNKAPPVVIEDCQDPKKRKLWLDKYIASESGEWKEITAKERLEESEEQTKSKERNWMFPYEMKKKFGAAVAKAYQTALHELDVDAGETDNAKK